MRRSEAVDALHARDPGVASEVLEAEDRGLYVFEAGPGRARAASGGSAPAAPCPLSWRTMARRRICVSWRRGAVDVAVGEPISLGCEADGQGGRCLTVPSRPRSSGPRVSAGERANPGRRSSCGWLVARCGVQALDDRARELGLRRTTRRERHHEVRALRRRARGRRSGLGARRGAPPRSSEPFGAGNDRHRGVVALADADGAPARHHRPAGATRPLRTDGAAHGVGRRDRTGASVDCSNVRATVGTSRRTRPWRRSRTRRRATTAARSESPRPRGSYGASSSRPSRTATSTRASKPCSNAPAKRSGCLAPPSPMRLLWPLASTRGGRSRLTARAAQKGLALAVRRSNRGPFRGHHRGQRRPSHQPDRRRTVRYGNAAIDRSETPSRPGSTRTGTPFLRLPPDDRGPVSVRECSTSSLLAPAAGKGRAVDATGSSRDGGS